MEQPRLDRAGRHAKDYCGFGHRVPIHVVQRHQESVGAASVLNAARSSAMRLSAEVSGAVAFGASAAAAAIRVRVCTRRPIQSAALRPAIRSAHAPKRAGLAGGADPGPPRSTCPARCRSPRRHRPSGAWRGGGAGDATATRGARTRTYLRPERPAPAGRRRRRRVSARRSPVGTVGPGGLPVHTRGIQGRPGPFLGAEDVGRRHGNRAGGCISQCVARAHKVGAVTGGTRHRFGFKGDAGDVGPRPARCSAPRPSTMPRAPLTR